jgi:hypothetical protein
MRFSLALIQKLAGRLEAQARTQEDAHLLRQMVARALLQREDGDFENGIDQQALLMHGDTQFTELRNALIQENQRKYFEERDLRIQLEV